MKYIAIFAIALASGSAWAKTPCSTPAQEGAQKNLARLARISEQDARKAALAAARPGSTVVEGELEAEHGCLVYSFDLQVPGAKGIDEIIVDAGNGRVLLHSPETPEQEAAEKHGIQG